jgi:hypothetical protein
LQRSSARTRLLAPTPGEVYELIEGEGPPRRKSREKRREAEADPAKLQGQIINQSMKSANIGTFLQFFRDGTMNTISNLSMQILQSVNDSIG